MSRPNPGRNSETWHTAVMQWHKRLVKRFRAKRRRLEEESKKPGNRLLSKLKVSVRPPYPLSRFLRELDSHIARAEYRFSEERNEARKKNDSPEERTAKEKEKGCVKSASCIVLYYCASRKCDIDPRVNEFMERARLRYCAAPRRDIKKALLLTKPTRGNPGLVPGKRRRTEALYEEAAAIVDRLRREGKSEKFAVLDAREQLGVHANTIRRAVRRKSE